MTTQRVVRRGRGRPSTTSGTRTPACAAIKRRQRLVLDLLQPPDRRAARWVSVGEQPPATSQPLGVLRVAAEHAHLQRAPVRVMADVLAPRRSADAPRTLKSPHLDPKRGERGRARAPRAACPPRIRTPAAPMRRPRGRAPAPPAHRTARRPRVPRHRRPPVGDEPRGEHSNRADELRAGDGDHGDHEREPQLGEAPPGPQVGLDREPVCFDHTTEHARRLATRTLNATSRSRTKSQRRQRSASATIASARSKRGQERRTPERRGPPEHRDQRLGDALVLVRSRLRDHGRERRDQCRRRKEHDVDRPAVPPPRIPSNEKTEMPGRARRDRLLVARPGRRRQEGTWLTAQRSEVGETRDGLVQPAIRTTLLQTSR